MTAILLPGNDTYEYLLIENLMNLDEAGFEDAMYVMREVDKEHVDALASVPADELPAIQVVNVRIGECGDLRHAVVDGTHRWKAAIARGDTTIKAIASTYPSEDYVIVAAFNANMKHGLKASKQTRTDFAVWLYLTDAEEKLSMREIARMTNLNVSTVSRAIKKLAEDEADSTRTPDAPTKKLVTALRSFYKAERSFLGSLGIGKSNSQKAIEHRTDALYKYVASRPKSEHAEILQELSALNATLTAFMGKVYSK